jgi:hypothetical protein
MRKAQLLKHKAVAVAEAAAAATDRCSFVRTRASPGWRQRAEEGIDGVADRAVREGARGVLRRRAPTSGFWVKAGASRKATQTREKERTRDELFAKGHAIVAPCQDGAELARRGYWISPGFVLETTKTVGSGADKKRVTKQRFCVNEKEANKRYRKKTFKNDKIEDIAICMDRPIEMAPVIEDQPHVFSWDVEGAFTVVGIYPPHTMRHCVDLGPDVSGPRFMVYIVLPFGWTLSPYFWGAVAKVPITEMRAASIPTLLYVDDGLNGGKTLKDALANRDKVEEILQRYGIPQARDESGWPVKGSWTPVRRLEHLGEYMLLPENRFQTPVQTCEYIRQQSHALLRSYAKHRGRLNAGWIASYAGVCLSRRRSVQFARYHCRGMFDSMKAAGVYRTRNYGLMVKVSKRMLDNIRWWSKIRSNKSISRSIWRGGLTQTWAADSSGSKWGGLSGVEVKPLNERKPGEFNGTPVMRIWSDEIKKEHITMKELRTVDEMIEMEGHTVANGVLGFLQDNMSVVAILTNFVCRTPEMMAVLDRIIANLVLYDIELRLFYCNTHLMPADWFSRDANKGDWQLLPAVANRYMHQWGTCTVDRFADFQNALLPRFNAAYPCVGSEALDCMTQDWRHERSWINAPWAMIGKVLFKLRSTPEAAATLLIPHWPSAVWWPALADLVTDFMVLHDASDPELTLPDAAFVPGAMLAQTDRVPEPLRNRGWTLWLVNIPSRVSG